MNIFIHPEFNPNLRVNDIALIQVISEDEIFFEGSKVDAFGFFSPY